MALLHMNFLKKIDSLSQQSWRSWITPYAQNTEYDQFQGSALFVCLQKDVSEALREWTYTNKKK